jgi:hypothetical protein
MGPFQSTALGFFCISALLITYIVTLKTLGISNFKVKREITRLQIIEETKADINKALSGTVLMFSFDYRLKKLDQSTLFLIKELVSDITLAARMRQENEEATEEILRPSTEVRSDSDNV